VPLVVLASDAARALAGGAAAVEVEATNFRRLVAELERRFPGLGRHVETGMAVAVDGVIHQSGYGAAFDGAKEIVLIPRIGGG
jgi:sulfur-carrier protein